LDDELNPWKGQCWDFFSSLCADRLWSPPRLLSSEYWGLLPWG